MPLVFVSGACQLSVALPVDPLVDPPVGPLVEPLADPVVDPVVDPLVPLLLVVMPPLCEAAAIGVAPDEAEPPPQPLRTAASSSASKPALAKRLDERITVIGNYVLRMARSSVWP